MYTNQYIISMSYDMYDAKEVLGVLANIFIYNRQLFIYNRSKNENILGPVHMHTFTYVSKVTYVSNFTYGVM